MAQIGLRYPMYAPLTEDETSRTFEYGDGKVAAKAIRVDINLNVSDSPLYADDEVAERVREFIDGTITFTPDDLPLEVRGDWLGNQTDEETVGDETVEVLDSSTDDLPGYFGFGYIIPKIKRGVRYYRAIFFPKVQFGEPNETVETKGESITWQTPAIEGKIMRRIDTKWKREITSTSLDTALNWLRFQPTYKELKLKDNPEIFAETEDSFEFTYKKLKLFLKQCLNLLHDGFSAYL